MGPICLEPVCFESHATESNSSVGAAFERPNVTFYSSETLTADADTATPQHVVEQVERGCIDRGSPR